MEPPPSNFNTERDYAHLLPDWSDDDVALTTHVRYYWIAMGVPTCQIHRTQVSAKIGSDGSHQRTVSLARSLDEIPSVESSAYARINNADQSTSEGFLWPAIPANVVASARSFRAQLADPAAVAAYRAKLPPEAQGDGTLVVHHSAVSLVLNAPFKAGATWDVLFGSAMHSYDASGKEVIGQW